MSDTALTITEQFHAAKQRSDQAKADAARKLAEMETIHTRAEGRGLTTGEQERWENLDRGLKRSKADAADADAEYRELLSRGLTSGAFATESANTSPAFTHGVNVNLNRIADPWDYSRADRVGTTASLGDIVDRAKVAIERAAYASDDARQVATTAIESGGRGGDPKLARWAVVTSSPDYFTAVQKLIGNPTAAFHEWTPGERTAYSEAQEASRAMSLSDAAGGFMVPFTLDPAVNVTNAGSIDSIRKVATVKQIATDAWNGVNSAGVTAEWIAEATEVADASPTLTQPSITAHKADAYVQASIEVSMDAANFASEISDLIADAKDNLEATAFTLGTGSGQPFGTVTRLQLTTASRVSGSSGAAGAADFVIGDVYALSEAVPARHRLNATWHSSLQVQNKVRRFGEGATGTNSAFWADLGGGAPSLLLGKPYYENAAMDTSIVSGSTDDVLMMGDFRKYIIVDRVGLTMVYNPLVIGSNRRPTGEVGWFAYWRAGGDWQDVNAGRLLRL